MVCEYEYLSSSVFCNAVNVIGFYHEHDEETARLYKEFCNDTLYLANCQFSHTIIWPGLLLIQLHLDLSKHLVFLTLIWPVMFTLLLYTVKGHQILHSICNIMSQLIENYNRKSNIYIFQVIKRYVNDI